MRNSGLSLILPALVVASLAQGDRAPLFGRAQTGEFQSESVQSTGQDPHKPDKAKYTSSATCKTCHSGIYKYWSSSMHATAVSDPAFQMSYARAIASYGVDIRKYCLSCHSPTTNITKDYDLKDPVSKEGITCDFCHTVVKVIPGKPKSSFEVQLGDTKFGPLPNVEPTSGLQFKYSVLHKSSELCSGCHELESDSGAKIIGTYTEWKESSYAKKNIQCQNCHMPELLDVPVVDPSVKKVQDMAHAHEFLGGHSQIRLEKAATLQFTTERNQDKLLVDAFVTNAEAGHYLPTGLPTRKVVLVVTLKNQEGKIFSSQERVYQKVMLDAEGKEICETQCAMVEAHSVKSDTRIKPGEVRSEHFEFSGLKDNEDYIVEAGVQYRFEVATLERNVMNVDMVSGTKIIQEASKRSTTTVVVIAVSLVIVIFIAAKLAASRRKVG